MAWARWDSAVALVSELMYGFELFTVWDLSGDAVGVSRVCDPGGRTVNAVISWFSY
jgi:hypothetical protein